MARVFFIGVMVAAIILPIAACKKKEEVKAPAAVEQSNTAAEPTPGQPAPDQPAPAQPVPAPDKPET